MTKREMRKLSALLRRWREEEVFGPARGTIDALIEQVDGKAARVMA